jgi:heparinase II/III-like protein
MQPLSWYFNRLRSMSPSEVAWRIQSATRDALDRYRIPAGRYPTPADAIAAGKRADDPPAFRVSDVTVGEWTSSSRQEEKEWCRRLRAEADRVVNHELTFFDREGVHLGNPIRWNYEVKAAKGTPLAFAPSLDYRDYRVVGDCKLVWEPNRHHQLVVLGRAYRASGDRRYADAVVEQLESWLDQCPFGFGMNWRSPLELGIRLINWVWALDLIRESGAVAGAFEERVIHSVYLHIWEITRKLSRGSSGNNHLTGELAGVYLAATYFSQLANREEWRRMAARRLEQQIQELAAPDGGWREHAVGYQLFVLHFFLACGLGARAVGEDFSTNYWTRVERMLEFVADLLEGGPLPAFGDADDGYVLSLGGQGADAPGLLSTGAVLFGNGHLKQQSGGFREMARWFLPSTAADRYQALAVDASARLPSRAFKDCGYYLLQSGHAHAPDRISVFFDCAELGFGAIAAHGHADALSFTLRAFGRDVLVDPGTYDYFTYPEWRTHFRSTRAHNTVTIDGKDQSEMLGPFLWGARANSRLVAWEPSASGGKIVGEHDGYSRLPSPVLHRRTLELDGDAGTLIVRDELRGSGEHDVALVFQAAEDVECRWHADRVVFELPEGIVTLRADPALTVTVVRGAEEPIGGWTSRRYHVKRPSSALVARAHARGDASFTCRLSIVPREVS